MFKNGSGPTDELEDMFIIAPLRFLSICGNTIQHIMVREPMLILMCCQMVSSETSVKSIGISYITPTLFTMERFHVKFC